MFINLFLIKHFMVEGHKIEKKLDPKKFLDNVKKYKIDQIITTDHTFFRLAEKQRKIYKESVIKEYLLSKTPLLVGMQQNENYAVFYDYSESETLKIILGMDSEKLYIVTFYITNKYQIPKI